MSHSSLPLSVCGWNLEYSYRELPQVFYADVLPEPVRAPQLVFCHKNLAEEMGLDLADLPPEVLAGWFSGNILPPGARPLAQAYAGHQFGHFTMLGDGRALIIGEQVGPDGQRRDLQWKGSGRTPFSRRGDGRAALGPMLREVLISEALHHLGLPTTRSLAVVTTGEVVYRDRPLPGAVLTRVAASHLRVGTFEFASALRNREDLERLTRYALRRHYEEPEDSPWPGRDLLTRVAERQMELVARWMSFGFIHGVLNTDNVAISGEAIDFGPCAFMDAYAADTVFSSIDRYGRYAYARQPEITLWNLARLAEALLPVIAEKEADAVAWAEDFLRGCQEKFPGVWLRAFRPKLGLFTEEAEDAALVRDLLAWMEKAGADFTNTFRELSPVTAPIEAEKRAWWERWVARLQRQPQSPQEVAALRAGSNPVVHPRNHRVEEALASAEAGDYRPFDRLLEVLREPFRENPDWEAYRAPAPPGGPPYQTFCGT